MNKKRFTFNEPRRMAAAALAILLILIPLTLSRLRPAFAAESPAGGLATTSMPTLESPLQRTECDRAGLLKSNNLSSAWGWWCRHPLAFGRTRTAKDYPEETVLRTALNKRTYRELAPVEATDNSTLSEMPRLSQFAGQCTSHPPLPDIPNQHGAAEAPELRGKAFDLRLDRLALRRGREVVVARPRDGMALYDLGPADATERLYALKAATYAEAKPGERTPPDGATDPRFADRGILHLFLMPSCRYAGGIVFASRARVETVFYRAERYKEANPDGTDIVNQKALRLKRVAHNSASPITAELVVVDGLGHSIFFVTAWPKRLSRSVSLLPGVAYDLRDSYDSHGWLKENAIDRLRREGAPIEMSVEESKYDTAIWEIRSFGGELQLALWKPKPSRNASSDELFRFESPDPGATFRPEQATPPN